MTLLVSWDTGWFCIICTHCQDSPSHAVIFYKPSTIWCMVIAGKRSRHCLMFSNMYNGMFWSSHQLIDINVLCSFFFWGRFFSTTFTVTLMRDSRDVIFQHSGEDCFLITVPSIKCLHFDIRELLLQCCHRRVISSHGCASATYVVMYIERDISNLCTGLMASALYWQHWISH